MANAHTRSKFVLCIENKDCDDLEKARVNPLLPDVKAKRDGYLRVIDESGEDYLYPESHFVSVGKTEGKPIDIHGFSVVNVYHGLPETQ